MVHDTAALTRRPPLSGITGHAGRILRMLADSLREHRVWLGIILLYLAALLAVLPFSPGANVAHIRYGAWGLVVMVLAVATVVTLVHSIWFMVTARPQGSLIRALAADYRRRFLVSAKIVGFLVVILPAPMFFSIFGSFKRMIPFHLPFAWDEAFMQADRWLHGGIDPWALLQPMFGTPVMTTFVNAFYHGWLFVVFFTLFWQAWSGARPRLRQQYLISFLLCWILIGSAMATALSSAGPVYYGRITGLEDPFAPLMVWLHAAHEVSPVWALDIQDRLWEVFTMQREMPGSGISAMPSMHVATAVLMALLGWRTGRIIGMAYTIFAVMIMIGSVHLGWHYAIDGYVAALVTLAIWYGTGRMLSRPGPAPAPDQP